MNREKLTLEHLAGYLPYGLKMIFESKGGRILEVTGIRKIKTDDIYFSTENETLCIDTFKPLLYPLSMLTKEIEVNGERFVPCIKLHLKVNDVDNFLNEDLWIGQWWDYEKVQKLQSWHIDIHGLIEKGLAIDKSTIKQ